MVNFELEQDCGVKWRLATRSESKEAGTLA